MSRSRVAYVKRNERARLHTPARKLPIIIVPTILGSRLTDPKDNALVWNPLGIPVGSGPQPFKVDTGRLQNKSVRLVADETHTYDSKIRRDKVRHIRHYANLIPEMYGRLAVELSMLELKTEKGGRLEPVILVMDGPALTTVPRQMFALARLRSGFSFCRTG